MNLHQILTGAANTGDKCFAVGSVEGNHFTVSSYYQCYAAIKIDENLESRIV